VIGLGSTDGIGNTGALARRWDPLAPRRSGPVASIGQVRELLGPTVGPTANTAIGSAFGSASDDTGGDSNSNFSHDLDRYGILIGACNKQEEGKAWVGPITMEDVGMASN
jgi:hypothetical protein